MREYLADPPRWVIGLLAGPLFALGAGVYSRYDGKSWTFAVAWGALVGTFFGFSFALLSGGWQQQRRVIGDLPPAKRAAARRTTWDGSIPADAETRSAALRLATAQLTRTLRWRKASIVFWGVVAASNAVSAFDEPWRLILVVVPLLLLVDQFSLPKRLRARIGQLSTDPAVNSEPRAG